MAQPGAIPKASHYAYAISLQEPTVSVGLPEEAACPAMTKLEKF